MLCYSQDVPDFDSALQPAPESRFTVRSYFVRYRNALAVSADLSPAYVDYYLHLMDQGIQHEPELDRRLKDALAAIVLHAVTRPRMETHAWTLNFQNPLMNLFVTASNPQGNLTGRIFTDGVREASRGLFGSQVTMLGHEPRTSTIEIQSSEIFPNVERFYAQSEQRRAKIFALGEEEFMMVSAQPDCDEEWLDRLDLQLARSLDEDEELALLEERHFQFECGCSLERIFPALAPIARQGLDALFQGDEAITVSCPRCAAKWRLTREQLEAVMGE